jgi:hypothetical protein
MEVGKDCVDTDVDVECGAGKYGAKEKKNKTVRVSN